jgi:hypothetical protein
MVDKVSWKRSCHDQATLRSARTMAVLAWQVVPFMGEVHNPLGSAKRPSARKLASIAVYARHSK